MCNGERDVASFNSEGTNVHPRWKQRTSASELCLMQIKSEWIHTETFTDSNWCTQLQQLLCRQGADSAVQDLHEGLAELDVEGGVDDGVHGTVDVAQPCEGAVEDWWDVAVTVYIQDVCDEERQPADDEHTWEEGEGETGLGGSHSTSTCLRCLHCRRHPPPQAPRLLTAGGSPRVAGKGSPGLRSKHLALSTHLWGRVPASPSASFLLLAQRTYHLPAREGSSLKTSWDMLADWL